MLSCINSSKATRLQNAWKWFLCHMWATEFEISLRDWPIVHAHVYYPIILKADSEGPDQTARMGLCSPNMPRRFIFLWCGSSRMRTRNAHTVIKSVFSQLSLSDQRCEKRPGTPSRSDWGLRRDQYRFGNAQEKRVRNIQALNLRGQMDALVWVWVFRICWQFQFRLVRHNL